MVSIKRDEHGNVEEVQTDFWDMLCGNEVKSKGKTIEIKYHGLFGIGTRTVIVPLKKEEKMRVVMRKENEVTEVNEKRKNVKPKKDNRWVSFGAGERQKVSDIPPELRAKLGLDD